MITMEHLSIGTTQETKPKESNLDLEAQIREIHKRIFEALNEESVPIEKIKSGEMRLQSILYMIYWFHRLRNNHDEQARIYENLVKYIGPSVDDPDDLSKKLFANKNLIEASKKYVETLLVPTKTVDLVITKNDDAQGKDKEVLCVQRTYYPPGLALPGGIIREEDEDNELNLPPQVFAALRVAGQKVLGLNEEARYSKETDEKGKECFVVRGESELPAVRLYQENEGGYKYRENIKSVLRPSDPRHIVDTIGFKCEIIGQPEGQMVWKHKTDIMSPEEEAGGFAFGHHREIVAFVTAQTSIEKERELKEREFVRSIINTPLEKYNELRKRFEENKNSPETSFKELFPVVDRLLAEAFSPDINELCEKIPLLAGVRDKAVISLRQVCLKNRVFCPYLPTLHAIAEAVAFFDIVARQKKGFYETMPKDQIVEHNPRTTPYASYHMYRYKYRFDQLLNMVPGEIIIPTFESLSATDLMKVRGIPVRFVGLSKDFLYVDEFEQ
jgi:hypothetical protein